MQKTLFTTIFISLLSCIPVFADAPSVNSVPFESESQGIEIGAQGVTSTEASVTSKVEVQAAPNETFAAASTDTVSGGISAGTPIERAKGEKLATAMGHYARARSLLVAAIREFDKGYGIVDPNALLDSRMWRESLLDRSEELARLLDPQPRATRGGVKFGSETRGIGDTSN